VNLVRREDVSWKDYRFDHLLNQVVGKEDDLRAYILAWDFSMIFALDREPFLYFKFGWRAHKRVHFHMDATHPVGASHHQKIVVIDDNLAFVGGIDITSGRWDTPDHIPDDPRRKNDDNKPYPPFHDTQMVVQGPVAAMLGDLFRKRWLRSKGEELAPPPGDLARVWPTNIEPEVKDVRIGISRTHGQFKSASEVREVERLFLDSIAAAKELIYIENQYLTSMVITNALIERLKEERGPVIIIITPLHSTGWLEEITMTEIRSIMVNRLRAADEHRRLRILYPYRTGLKNGGIKVHAKVEIIDDDFLRIGSSNISNRSMGLDTECDAALESGGRSEVRRAIRDFRHRLLGEHLGLEPQRLEEELKKAGSYAELIAKDFDNGRGLDTLPAKVTDTEDMSVPPPLRLADPERPIDPEELVEQFMAGDSVSERGAGLLKFFALICGLTILAGLWRWSPASQYLDAENLSNLFLSIRNSPAAPLAVVIIYIIGGIAFAPVSLIIGVVALVFSPWESFFYSTIGCLCAGLVTFSMGRFFGRERIQSLAGEKLNRISRRLASRGVLAVTALRLVPVAPFTVINIVMAASHVRLSHFMWGTALGMIPGVLAISLLGATITDLVFSFSLKDAAIFASALVLCMVAAYGIQRLVKTRIFKELDPEQGK
jgi:phosphatidylserine/phosphatidylglycerophosphate/cardiolipin synthase-like enzyme/membrane protein DedA with SNARE-associated domain